MLKRILFATTLLFSGFIVSAQEINDMEKDDQGNYVNAQTNSNTEVLNNNVGIQRVKDSIFMVKGRGGNIGLSIGEDGIFMIDDKFKETSANVLQRIRTVSNKPIELLVNTHHHGDHVGGNSAMSELGTVIFSHENARKRMAEPYTKTAKESYNKKMDSLVSQFGGKITSEEVRKEAYVTVENSMRNIEDYINIPAGLLPVVSFSKDLTFYYNGERIMLYHVPSAHTDGDVMVYFTKSNVLHTGDAFVNGTYPFIDTDNRGSLMGYVDGIDRIVRLINNETKIIPGHGNLSTMADVKYTQSMFRYLNEKIKFHIVDNKTVEEVLAMKDLTKEYDEKGFGEGFITTEKFVRTLYSETAKKYGKRK